MRYHRCVLIGEQCKFITTPVPSFGEKMKLQHYLDHIGYEGVPAPNLESLLKLQRAHVQTVPFENIDVQFGRTLTTSVEDAYHKIVNGKRGGWCYEQNGLFGWALGEIGFDVTRIAAGVMRHEIGRAADANHLCLLIRLKAPDSEYLADVGFGGSMIQPIPLRECAISHPPYRLGLRKLAADKWRFWEDAGSGEFSFDFETRPASEPALARKCKLLQSDPASSFVLNLVAELREPERQKILRGRVFTLLSSTGKTETLINSGEELIAILSNEFRIDLPQVAELWPRILNRHEEIGTG